MKFSEGGITLSVAKGVFYNPEMELCRSIFSLAVGALKGKISLADCMCASGVRGLRYKKENKNVSSLALVDLSRKAIADAKKNARLNKIKCKCLLQDANMFLYENECDFVELDPFGSPMPFLFDAARSFSTLKKGYLSVTATDMAVLCGAHHAACLKNYSAIPINNEFCHENAVRLLIATVIRTCAPFSLSAKPIFSISHRHYVKVLFELNRGSDGAVSAIKSNGYVTYCPKCLFREAKRSFPSGTCPLCGHQSQVGGPFYIGALWDPALLKEMLDLNVSRSYGKREAIEKMLSTMLAESGVDSYGYYDLHLVAKKFHKQISSMDTALEKIRAKGFLAQRTHFCPTAIRTNAPHDELISLL